jgi:hypothetical protein
MEQTETVAAVSLAEGKCPYLAGRPPHGTYKLWPSSINVCFGRPQDGKVYGHVSKETQERQCFGGEGLFCACSSYQHAQSHSITPPEFGRAMNPTDAAATEGPVRRVRKRRRKKHAQRREWMPTLRSIAFVVTLAATLVLVGMVLLR